MGGWARRALVGPLAAITGVHSTRGAVLLSFCDDDAKRESDSQASHRRLRLY